MEKKIRSNSYDWQYRHSIGLDSADNGKLVYLMAETGLGINALFRHWLDKDYGERVASEYPMALQERRQQEGEHDG